MSEITAEFFYRTGITLWDYQEEDAAKMVAGHFGCFQDPGLGKTYTALAALLEMEKAGHLDGPVIWIGPRLSLTMIAENIKKVWPKTELAIIRGTQDLEQLPAPFLLVTSDIIRNATVRERLIAQEAVVVVVDEAHRYKTHSAARTRALYGEDLDGAGGIIQGATYVWLLTGTPMPNGMPGELYAHLHALWPASIGPSSWINAREARAPMSWWNFRNKYHHVAPMVVAGRRVHVDRGAKNLEAFKKATAGCWKRRRLEDHLDLENPIIEETLLELSQIEEPTAEDRAVVKDLDAKHLSDLWTARDLSPDTILDSVNAQQISTAMRLTGALKVLPTVELIHQLLEDGAEQILVGFWHRDVGGSIAMRLHEEAVDGVGLVSGGSRSADAEAVITAFQEKKMTVLVGQISVVGEAHNLHNCHHVILAEQSWVPGQNKQFIARCHRQGQLSRVIVRSVCIKGSLDENLCRALTRKISDETEAMEDPNDKN